MENAVVLLRSLSVLLIQSDFKRTVYNMWLYIFIMLYA